MKEALKLALEALEWATSCMSFEDFDDMPEALAELNKAHEAITAVKEALAQPEQGHPQAWLVYAKGSRRYFTLTFDIEKVPEIYKGGEAVPLYTTPPERKPLTDAQREEIAKGWRGRNWTVGSIIDAIEAAHGIKGDA